MLKAVVCTFNSEVHRVIFIIDFLQSEYLIRIQKTFNMYVKFEENTKTINVNQR